MLHSADATRSFHRSVGRRRAGRQFAAVALLLSSRLLLGPARAASTAGEGWTVEVAPGLHVHFGAQQEADSANGGDIANIGFVVGQEAIAVIDTGGSVAIGNRLLASIRAVSSLPVRYVINTHVHPDHILGNAAFLPEHPVFVGHAALTDALARRGGFYIAALPGTIGAAAAEGAALVPPSLTVTGTTRLDLGGRILTVEAEPTAHTDNDLIVRDEETGTLWLADLLFVNRVPALDGNLGGWLKALDRLATLPARRAVPGHGPVVEDWPAALEPERRYLETLRRDVRAVIAAGGTVEQAMETAGRSEAGNWLLFDRYNRRNVAAAFVELEWE